MFEPTLNHREPRLDWPMWLAIFALMVIGTAFIYSTTSVYDTVGIWRRFREYSWSGFFGWLAKQFYFKQVFAYGLGLVMAVVFCLFDYHKLARWSLVIYWGSILLLVAVLIEGIGTTAGTGARRWIDLGFFNMQPSEFAKLSLVIALAHFLSRPVEELRLPGVFFKAIGMTLLPFLLILKEPDLGSALVLIPIGLMMMYVAEVPKRYLKRLVGYGAVFIGLLLVNVLFAPAEWQPLEQYQRERLLVYFGRDFASQYDTPVERQRAQARQRDKTYNVDQALISVGSGGLTGKGWRQGTQNALGFLPSTVAHNDFIFSVIAEEKGFLGSVLLIALYTVIMFTGIKIASQARDRLGRLLAIGVVVIFFSHVFVNIGMNIRIMPVTGIPLPLISYGGTSVLCTLIAAGILQNIYIYRRFY